MMDVPGYPTNLMTRAVAEGPTILEAKFVFNERPENVREQMLTERRFAERYTQQMQTGSYVYTTVQLHIMRLKCVCAAHT